MERRIQASRRGNFPPTLTRPRDRNAYTIFTNNPDTRDLLPWLQDAIVSSYPATPDTGSLHRKTTPTRARRGTSEDEGKNELVTSLKTDRDRGRRREEAPTNPETLPSSRSTCYLSFCHLNTLPSLPLSVSPGHPYAANRPPLVSGGNGQSRKSQPEYPPRYRFPPLVPSWFETTEPTLSRPFADLAFPRRPLQPDSSRTMIFRQVGDRSMRIKILNFPKFK